MSQKPKKKSKSKGIVLAIILILIIGVGIFAYMKITTAKKEAQILANRLVFDSFDYKAKVELNPEKLDSNLSNTLRLLSHIAGIEEDDMYNLNVKGTVDGGVIRAEIYPQGASKPLVELYLSDGEDYVNGKILYENMTSRIIEKSPLAALIIPKWNETEYISLSQSERLLGSDMSRIKNFKVPLQNVKLPGNVCQLLLSLMSRTENGNLVKYTLNTAILGGSGTVEIEWDESSEEGVVLRLNDLENPAQLVESINKKLEGLNKKVSIGNLGMLEKITLEIQTNEATKFIPPVTVVSEGLIEKLITIVEMIRQFT